MPRILRSPGSKSFRLENVSVPNADGARCERRRHRRRPKAKSAKGQSRHFDRGLVTFAVGTRVTSRPPHRSVRAQFGHTACMGLSLSRRHHAISVVLRHSILLFDLRRKHSFVPTAHLHRRRAQRRSRTALLQRRRRLVLDGREHGGRLLAIG